MFYPQAVAPGTLELLKKLMKLPALNQFALVGGTNLALRFGHRLSIDFDLFSDEPFEPEQIYANVRDAFPNTEFISSNQNMLFLFIENIKTDFVRLPFAYIQPVEVIEGIRLASAPDIVAMKLSAISQRGIKKDFWDIAELLNYYSIEEMLAMFQQKYGQRDILYVLRSLVYFEDAEPLRNPDALNNLSWQQVKSKVQVAVKRYIEARA